MAEMRCLLTGAAGFLGSHLLAQLLERGDAVTLLLRPTSSTWRIQHLLPHVEVMHCDLFEVEKAGVYMKTARPEIVYHLAWAGGGSGRHQNALTQIEDNLSTSTALLRKAVEAGTRRWVGFGSAAEYGLQSGLISELVIPQPHTLYGIGKYALCLAAAKMCSLLGVECIWARPFGIYGPQDHFNGLLPFVARTLLRRERPALTTGQQIWDYLHVEDAAQAFVHLAQADSAHGVYNVASGTAQTIRSVVERLRDEIDPALPLGFGELPYQPDQLMNLQADVSKLKEATLWVPKISLEEGLREVIREFSEGRSS